MGGNAFNSIGYKSERMNKDEFHKIENEIFTVLNSIGIHSLSIPYVREKDSFGDIDIIVVKENDRNVKEIICKNIDKFGLTEEFINRNNDVISILYKQKYQIDFIFTNYEDRDYNQSYLAYNDLGNLIGRTIKESGFQHGHNGLFYVYREGNHFKKLILLTKDYDKALEILGLDVDKFYSGFDTFKDMFDYVSSSKYFKRSRFDLKNLNNRNRVRDRKRKVYNMFIEYIKDIPEREENVPSPFDEFPWLHDECQKIKESRIKINLISEKFNGNIISKLLKIEGKVVGDVIKFIKRNNIDEFILNSEVEEIEKFIEEEYRLFLLIS